MALHFTFNLTIGIVILFGGIQSNLTKVRNISIDCEKVKEVKLNSDRIQKLEIGIKETVSDVLFHNDLIIVRFKNSITAYDRHSGDSLFSYSRKGRRDDEYTSISNAWLVDDVLELYDFNSSKLLRFDVLTGKFLNFLRGNDLDKEHRFNSLKWDGKSQRFIGQRTFPGKPVPDLAIYDKSHHFVKDIESPLKKSGFFISSSPIIVSEAGRFLYHQPFNRVVYRIEGSRLIPEYSISFRKQTLPKSVSEDEGGEAMRFWIENQDKYAVAMEFFESKDSFFINYMLSNKGYLVRYDRAQGTYETFYFSPRGGKLSYHNGVFFLFTNEEAGTRIYIIPETVLK